MEVGDAIMGEGSICCVRVSDVVMIMEGGTSSANLGMHAGNVDISPHVRGGELLWLFLGVVGWFLVRVTYKFGKLPVKTDAEVTYPHSLHRLRRPFR